MTIRISLLRDMAVALAVLMLAFSLIGCGAEEPETIAPEPPAAENGNGEAEVMPDADAALVLVETKCSGCHELARVWAGDYDRAGWESTVARMEANGLQVTAEERAEIIDYLVEN